VKGLRAQGDLSRARLEIAPLLEAAPRSPSVHLESGELELAAKRYSDAHRAFTTALEMDPDSVDAVAGLVNVGLSRGQVDDARRTADDYLKRHPDSAQMLMIAGRAYAVQGQVADAERLLQKAIQADPGYMPAYHILGQLYVRQRKLADATLRYQEMAKAQPDSVPIHTMIGMLLQVQNRGDEAKQKYEQILQIDPRAAVAANNLAYMKAEAGVDLDIALQLAQTAKAVAPQDPDVNDTLGWVYYKKDLANLAIGPLKISVDRVPDNPIYRYHLGMAYVKTGDIRGAREMLQEALRLQPKFDGADQARAALATLGG
jgi:tetratricopeptide (TPR) repeat protein